MEVVNPRSALLSNLEVLALLRQLAADHVARTKTAIRIKKEEDASGKPTLEPHTEEVSENLRTVELEVSPSVPTWSTPLICHPDNPVPLRRVPAHATPVRSWRISARTRPCALLPHKSGETPSRKPCPDRARRTLRRVSPLHCTPYRPLTTPVRQIVEELEDRLGDRMHDILGIVSRSLSDTPATTPPQSPSSPTYTETVDAHDVEQGWDHDAADVEFDHLGEDVGVEGDLDMEDDD